MRLPIRERKYYMPRRRQTFTTGHYYHVFTRGTDKRNIFLEEKDYKRFIATLAFYRFDNPPVKLSAYYNLPELTKQNVLEELRRQSTIISLHGYCLMTNHVHLLLEQKDEDGIRMYLHRTLNSYTHFFNTKYKRKGTLVEGVFKAVPIKTEEEFMHVSRYIHLNPYSSHLTPTLEQCCTYPFSSLRCYIENIPPQSWIDTTYLKYLFPTPEQYKEFVLNQADYQRTLEHLKHQEP